MFQNTIFGIIVLGVISSLIATWIWQGRDALDFFRDTLRGLVIFGVICALVGILIWEKWLKYRGNSDANPRQTVYWQLPPPPQNVLVPSGTKPEAESTSTKSAGNESRQTPKERVWPPTVQTAAGQVPVANQPRTESSQGIGSLPVSPTDDFVGTWIGTMQSPEGFTFPVTIQLNGFTPGSWCGVLHHPPPLDADGNLKCIKIEGRQMTVSQKIIRGRERCLDGVNVLMLINNDTMERVWIDPRTGVGRDKGFLRRQKQ